MGLLFSAIDACIVSTSLVTISISLQDFLHSPWVMLSYLLAYLGFAIGLAKLSDIYGRRYVLSFSWILFVISSIVCARATTMTQLIIGRAFQGVGGSGLYSLSQIILFEAGPSGKPSLMGGLIGVTLAVSYVLGPILGAVISSTSQWTIIFWINVPVGVIMVISLYWVAPPEARLGRRGWTAIRKIDFIGNISVVLACALLVFALQEAGSYTYAWDSPPIVATLSISCLSWVVFFAWEIYISLKHFTHIEPIFPLRLLARKVYTSCLTCTFCTGYVYLSFLLILPERFQIVNGESALFSGIHLLPMLGATAFGAFFAGAISRKQNNTSWTLMAAHAFQLIGISLMTTLSDTTTETKAQYGFQVVLGLGFGLAFGAGTMMASVQSQHQDLAVAQGAVAQARVLGGAIAIAICSIVFNKKVTTDLGDAMRPDDINALRHSPTITSWLPEDAKLLVQSTYAQAFTSDIYVMIGIAVVGVIASILTYEKYPPAMPSSQTKEAYGEEGLSETELRLVNGCQGSGFRHQDASMGS
ncbi:hypothetical protein M426DRAFT_73723 [Hypoxylon sp. CI-4A]|nr:hypothetical protein M426DRAFT_73723 [Hypoxylon sp. CI-4A]